MFTCQTPFFLIEYESKILSGGVIMPRFFAGKPENGLFTLTGGDAHHASRVLRLRTGDTVVICDGECTDYECTVEHSDGKKLICRVHGSRASAGETKQRITLFMALPKGDKMDFIVQKAVELGADRIVPYISRNCVSRPDNISKKAERWGKIATEAAGQCGRGRIPVVQDIITVREAFEMAALNETALFFYENEGRVGLKSVLSAGIGSTVSLVIGPEGGFDPAEAVAAKEAGLVSVSLGSRVLRCETAPIVALSAVLYAGGNMEATECQQSKAGNGQEDFG